MILLKELNEKSKKLPFMVDELISAIEKANWEKSERNTALEIAKSLQNAIAEPRYLGEKPDYLELKDDLNPYNSYKRCLKVCTKNLKSNFSFLFHEK